MNESPYLNEVPVMGFKIIKAFIDPSVKIGEGSIIWHFARVLAGVRIGKNVSIGGGTEIGRGSVIGDNTRIGANTFLPPNTMVGPNVFIGPNVTCTDDRHPVIHAEGDAPYHAEPPVIEEGAAVGAGSVLLPGVRIGKHARVAAGSIVTKDVIEYGMVMGRAAKPRTMPREWEHPSWGATTTPIA